MGHNLTQGLGRRSVMVHATTITIRFMCVHTALSAFYKFEVSHHDKVTSSHLSVVGLTVAILPFFPRRVGLRRPNVFFSKTHVNGKTRRYSKDRMEIQWGGFQLCIIVRTCRMVLHV